MVRACFTKGNDDLLRALDFEKVGSGRGRPKIA